jgi:hypothetical protein
VSLATGQVLESFESIIQAERSLGLSNDRGIIGVLNNEQNKSVHGYFWRPKGSNAKSHTQRPLPLEETPVPSIATFFGPPTWSTPRKPTLVLLVIRSIVLINTMGTNEGG